MTTQITINYRSVDRFSKSGTFKTLAGAQRFAQRWMGETPEIAVAFGYAVSYDGIGKITVRGTLNGAQVTLMDLFPKCGSNPTSPSYDE